MSVLMGMAVLCFSKVLRYSQSPCGSLFVESRGFVQEWIDALALVWCQQTRWITWGGCIMPEKVHAGPRNSKTGTTSIVVLSASKKAIVE